MKYGVNTFIWTANFTRENLPLLPEIKRHGFDGVEVPLFRPADFALADIRKGLDLGTIEMRNVAPTLAKLLGIRFPSATLPALPILQTPPQR